MRFSGLGLIFFLGTVAAQGKYDFVLLEGNVQMQGHQQEVLTKLPSIEIKTTGYVLLAHRTGEFIGFEQDTVLNLHRLDSSILMSKRMTECFNDWPNYALLYKTRYLDCWPGALSISSSNLELLMLNKSVNYVHPDQAFGLVWKRRVSGTNRFQLDFHDILVEPIGKLEIEGFKALIETDTMKLEESILVIGLKNLKGNGQEKVEERGVELNSSYYYPIDSFEANTSEKALQIAFWFEEIGACNQSTPYYALAAKNSKHSFYKKMLQNHEMRTTFNR